MEKQTFNGIVKLTNRDKLEVEGVEGVSAFDDDFLSLILSNNALSLIIEGANLVIDELNKCDKKIVVHGYFNSIYFSEAKSRKGKKGYAL